MDRSKFIFENEISDKAYRKAVREKTKYFRKYGDDSGKKFHLKAEPAPAIGDILGVRNLVTNGGEEFTFSDKSVIIGNIRMGFGHYRISIALASAAHSMGYEPYWFDLHSFQDAMCGKIIDDKNRLYSLGSKISQRSKLFNKFVWDPLNSEGFRLLSYNCSDQKISELMTSVFTDIPKDIPFLASHVWPSQAAVHAGLTNVVNVIPDNWPMALHLSEGAVHTVQTPSAYIGYRAMRGMDKKRQLKPMPKEAIEYTGHYIDHELVVNIEDDCAKRKERAEKRKPVRWLLSIGGAGAQMNLFTAVIKRLLPDIKKGKAVLLLNAGDHINVLRRIVNEMPYIKPYLNEHINDFEETKSFCSEAYSGQLNGIHVFCHENIFSAVYSTNLLMRISDVLITKPSELSFYPIPKLMIQRVGGHEAWGAIRSAEIGDGTYECSSVPEIISMIDLMSNDGDIISQMCGHICDAKKNGIYDGAYRAVQLAVRNKS